MRQTADTDPTPQARALATREGAARLHTEEHTMSLPQLGDLMTIEQLKGLNAAHGMHFFSASSMRFFRSRVGSNVYAARDGWVFVTSEQFDDRSPRLYTVRLMREDGRIDEVGSFQQYKTNDAANRAARQYAIDNPPPAK